MIYIDERTLSRAQQMLKNTPGAIKEAHKNALDHAIKGMKEEACSEVSRVYYVDSGRVAKSIVASRGNRTALSAKMVAKGYSIPLIDFMVTPKKFASRQAPFYSAAVKRGNAPEALNKSKNRKPFLLKRRDGHLGLYRRVGYERYPVGQLWGPAIPVMMGSKEIRSKIEERGKLDLYDKLEQEIGRLMGGK